MMPGMGLYLPDSSYRAPDVAIPYRAETQALRRLGKYLEMKIANQSQESIDRKSMAISRKSSEDVTKAFSSLATVFDFADFASSEGKVSSENEIFVNLIQRVRQDVTEASRLYTSHSVTDYLDSWPDKKTWIDAILLDIQKALNDIGVYMETVRFGGDDGGTGGLRRKFEWVLSHHKKLISKQQYLTLCHQSLMAAVQVMQSAEMNGTFGGHDPIYEAPARPWVRDQGRDILRSPHSRQKWRLSQRNLSLPSIMVSQAGADKADAGSVISVNFTPIELPGSTPDDLPLPNNLDLYAPPPKPRSASMDATVRPRPNKEILQTPFGSEMSSLPLDRAPPLPPPDPLAPRRSFDHVRPSVSILQERPRASFDQPRPRAHSNQVRPQRSFDMRPRGSFDQGRPLPTLNEKPIERYDSSASVDVKEAASLPLTGLRYRPKAVQVRKPLPKHNSLPIRLPSLKSESSLFSDLSQWILPSAALESHQNIPNMDSNVSLDLSTPSTSLVSSPVVPSSPATAASCPAVMKGPSSAGTSPILVAPSSSRTWPASVHTISPTRVDEISLPARAPPLEPGAESSYQPHVAVIGEGSSEEQTSTSVPREDSPKLIQRVGTTAQLGPNTKDDVDNSDPAGATMQTAPSLAGESTSHSDEQLTVPEDITRSTTAAPPLPPRPSLITDVQPQSSANEPSKCLESSTPEPQARPSHSQSGSQASTLVNPASVPLPPSVAPPSEVPQVEVGASEAHKPTPSSQPSQPLTAAAKRRAAHARRMQLAFGSES